MAALAWGQRYLMCPPDHFGIEYSINPWMDTTRSVDPERATEQWQALRRNLVAAGAEVEVLAPQPGLPDLVFTANAGLVDGSRFVPAAFRFRERRGEQVFTQAWFAARGFAVHQLTARHVQEGAGDALPFGDVLVAGHGPRSARRSYRAIAELSVAVLPVRLVDPRLYHLDIVFCPLDERRALIAPLGLDRAGVRALSALVPEPIELTPDDALRFAANSVVVGSTVVMPHVPVGVGLALERAGFAVVEQPMSEFMKAGGACRCLTLALDTTLSLTARSAAQVA